MNDANRILEKSAAQLLRHYERCGLTLIPVPTGAWAQAWETQSSSSEPIRRPSNPKTPAVHGNEVGSTSSAEPETAKPGQASNSLSEATSPKSPNAQQTRPPSSSPPLLQIESNRWETAALSASERQSVFVSLGEVVQNCTLCKELACTRKQTVFGVGSLQPRVVLFGEAPGAEEDRQGIPFVGPAGQLLDKIITAAKMKRDELFILNSLKCRPPGNRSPTDDEIARCRPFFEKQLDVLQPEFIVCLGAVASRAVLQTTESVGRLRGRFHQYRAARVLVTYHPSYLLRNESAKRFVWDDMQMLMREMGLIPK